MPTRQRDFPATRGLSGGATLEAIEAVTAADATSSSRSRTRASFGFAMVASSCSRRSRVRARRARRGRRGRCWCASHADYFLELAEDANLNAGTLRPGGQRLDLAIAEQDNIRRRSSGRARAGISSAGLVCSPPSSSSGSSTTHRGVRRHAAVLDLDGAADPALQAEALRSYASSADIAGDGSLAPELYGRSLAIFDELGDAHGRAVLLHRFAIQAMFSGDLERARAFVGESHAPRTSR